MRSSATAEKVVSSDTSARRRVLIPLAVLAIIFSLQLLAGLAPRYVERYYSLKLFPQLARVFAFARFFSFSLAEILSALLLSAFILWLAWLARRLRLRRTQARRILLSTFARSLWLACFGVASFLLVFGLNYQRQPLAETFGLERREPAVPEIEAISREVVESINRDYAESGASVEGERGSRMPLTPAQLYEVLEAAYEREPLLQGSASVAGVSPKPIYLSGLLSRFGISGVYSPFTGEANYNAIQTECDLPFTVAHEMAHQRGFAREDEANFIAFLVCTKASHPFVRYSGYLNALRVLGVLRRLAPERYREIVAAIGEGPRADLKARALFWSRYSGRLSDFGQGINHVYLKVNGVRSGVKNYNEAVWLIIGYYLKQTADAARAAD
ncbi:MAG: DUF3810 domain-containing protein [Acidobacteria bacterium]|nr:DUF3810 domain-containing protein [Acidobacteriota bacterium]